MSNTHSIEAIILAAGAGSRLGAENNNAPKCLLRIGEKTLLDYQIESLQLLGITKVTMVLGYEHNQIIEHIRDAYPDISFSFVFNSRYAHTNTAYSLLLALEHSADNCIIMNADVFFHPELLRRLACSPRPDALAVERKDTGEEEVKVVLDGIYISAIGKKIPSSSAYGEFIGLAKLSASTAQDIRCALRTITAAASGDQQYFESAFDRVLRDKSFCAVDISDLPCIEIDFPEDLYKARTSIVWDTSKADVKTTILFYIERSLHLPFLEPVLEKLSANSSVEAAFSAPSYRISRDGRTGYGLPSGQLNRLKERYTWVQNPGDFHADIAVVADACFFPVRHAKSIVTVGHGLISKGWFYTDTPAVRRENAADLICVPGQWHKSILEKNIFSRIAVTGFIKSDSVYACSAHHVASFKNKLHIGNNDTVILFAPTFNEELSAIDCIRERIAELSDDSTVVLIKLHAMTDERWVSLYTDLARKHTRVHLIGDEAYGPAMRSSDLLISDVSSIFVEFLLLDKPVILYNNPKRHSYRFYDKNNIEYLIRNACYEADTFDELKRSVNRARNNPGEHRTIRNRYAHSLSCAFDGDCAGRAAEAIMDLSRRHDESRHPGILFSILVHWTTIPSDAAIVSVLETIERTCRGYEYEVVFLGNRPSAFTVHPSINAWVENPVGSEGSVAGALNQCSGDYYILFSPSIVPPDKWIDRLYNYFRWYDDTGAVAALNCFDNYQEILSSCPSGVKLESMKDISEYFYYALMGNELQVSSLNTFELCVMVSRDAYIKASAGAGPLCGIEHLSRSIASNGMKLWKAPELFVYTESASDTASLLTSMLDHAKRLRRDNLYGEAVSLLEQAKTLFNKPACGKENVFAGVSYVDFCRARAHALKRTGNYTDAIALLESAKHNVGQSSYQTLDTLRQH